MSVTGKVASRGRFSVRASSSKNIDASSVDTDDSAHLPAGKDFHYFLSHKKSHTVHGGIPAQIAKNMHDSLELLGYRGWFEYRP
jgi:hypothetical protein